MGDTNNSSPILRINIFAKPSEEPLISFLPPSPLLIVYDHDSIEHEILGANLMYMKNYRIDTEDPKYF